ncbi:hypothetical protein [Paenibacillus sp. 1P03SA]|uniref:hypothetical protein n=1 Tax=Paenibacillus sp. 1P03SA TaxID=3132294 RepID=UPI0039A3E638
MALLHAIFQRHGIMPHLVTNAPDVSRHLMYASMLLVLEQEEKERKLAQERR